MYSCCGEERNSSYPGERELTRRRSFVRRNKTSHGPLNNLKVNNNYIIHSSRSATHPDIIMSLTICALTQMYFCYTAVKQSGRMTLRMKTYALFVKQQTIGLNMYFEIHKNTTWENLGFVVQKSKICNDQPEKRLVCLIE